MNESIGNLYVEVRANANKIKSDMDSIEREVRDRGKKIEAISKQTSIQYNNSMAKKSLAEIEQSAIKLKAHLEKKIQMGAPLEQLEALKNSLDKAEGALKSFKKKAEDNSQIKKSFTEVEESGNKIKTVLLATFAAMGGMAILHKILDFGKKIVNTASEFETLRTRLVSLYGDVQKASDVFEKFKLIAATTPYSLKEVVEAGSTIKAFGMDAENTLKSVTDLAAYMGLNVVEAASAVGRAFAGGVGAADILRERGVLNLIKSFKGIDDLTKLTLPEFRKALLETMSDPAAKIAGSTDSLSKTFAGMMSNMGDSMDNFLAKIGSKLVPIITPAVQYLQKVFEKMGSTAVDEFDKMSAAVANTEKNIVPLIGTYSILMSKTTLNKEEHEKLKSVIKTMGDSFPAAITQWDNYGNAIAISTSKLWELIKAEKERLKYVNREAIQQTFDDYGSVNQKMESLKYRMKKGTRTSGESGAVVSYTQDELAQMQNELTALGVLKAGIEAQYKRLIGEDIKVNEKPNVTTTKLSDEELKKQESLRDKFYKDLGTMADGYQKREEDRIKKEADEYLKAGAKKIDVEKWVASEKIKLLRQLNNFEILKRDGELNRYADLVDTFSRNAGKSETPGVYAPSPVEKVPIPNDWKNDFNTQNDKDVEEDKKKWEEDNKFYADTSQAAINTIYNGWNNAISDIISGTGSFAERTTHTWTNMANDIIAQLARIGVQYALLTGAKAIFSGATGGFGGFLINALGGHDGGEFLGTSAGVKRLAGGGAFTVPPGFPNDSYPLLVESGERVSVTPANKVGLENGALNSIYQQLQVLNLNLISQTNSKSSVDVSVRGRLANNDIYLSGERGGRNYRANR